MRAAAIASSSAIDLSHLPERAVPGREVGLDLEVVGRARRDRLELRDQLRGVVARGVDEHEHAARVEVVGLVRGDLQELLLGGARIAGDHSAEPSW